MTANLLSRLQGLTAPNREVDAEIDTTLFGGETVWKQANGTMEMYPASLHSGYHKMPYALTPAGRAALEGQE